MARRMTQSEYVRRTFVGARDGGHRVMPGATAAGSQNTQQGKDTSDGPERQAP